MSVTTEEILDALTDRTALAGTMWAEGRGDWRQGNSSVEERIAIGCAVRNRVHDFSRFKATDPTYRSVCLARAQFSCWAQLGGAANFRALMNVMELVTQGAPSLDMVFEETLYLADGILSTVILDRTGGATNYYAPKAMKPIGRVPREAVGRSMMRIGDQLFYMT